MVAQGALGTGCALDSMGSLGPSRCIDPKRGSGVLSREGLASVAALVLAACGEGSEPGADVDDAAVGPSVVATAEDSTDPVPSTTTEGDDVFSGGGAVRDGDLDGRQFVAQSIEGHELVPGSQVLLWFFDGDLGLTGCNLMGASYSLDGEMLTIEMEGSEATEMFCGDALVEQDDLFMGVLIGAGPIPVTLDGGELVIEAPSGRVTFVDREIADPNAPLEGTEWILVRTERKGGPFGVGEHEYTSLVITDGTAVLNNGCLSGSGPVEVAADTLTFGTQTSNGRCDRPAKSRFEKMMFRNLSDGEFTYMVVADCLYLSKTEAPRGSNAVIGFEFAADGPASRSNSPCRES
jgi:heat shock protein HslJ